MKPSGLVAAILLGAVAVSGAQAGLARRRDTAKSNSFIVQYKPEFSGSNLQQIASIFRRDLSAINAARKKRSPQDSEKPPVNNEIVQVIDTLPGFSAISGTFSPEVIAKLENDPRVLRIVPNDETYLHAPVTPSNASTIITQTNAIWSLDRIDQPDLPLNGRYSYEAIGGEGVDVYILDNGVRVADPEFEGRATLANQTFAPITDKDTFDHGTHVAGTVGSKAYGVAKKASIISVKVCTVHRCQAADLIAGLAWVVEQVRLSGKRAVVNSSNGFSYNPTLNDAYVAAANSDVVVVVSAGNDSSDACYKSPASAGGSVLTVGSTMRGDSLSGFSNWGKCVDIYAPGDDITSVGLTDGVPRRDSGTSMAAPVVAGIAAIYRSMYPEWSAQQVADTIKASAAHGKIERDNRISANRLVQTPKSSDPLPEVSHDCKILNRIGWVMDWDCCAVEEVRCDAQAYVTELYLSDVHGAVPRDIAELERLSILFLSYPAIEDYSALGSLPHLEKLTIQDMQMEIPLPVEFFNITSLRVLNIAFSSITGSLPEEIGQLQQLERLSIYPGKLTGPIPASIGSLANLKELHIMGHSLSGEIPEEIFKLSGLQSLRLSQNQLRSIPPALGRLTNLKALDLSGNGFESAIPLEITNLTNLEELALRDNKLYGPISPSLAKMTKLRKLDLRNNNLTGTIPQEFATLPELLELKLQMNFLNGTLPTFSKSTLPQLCPQKDSETQAFVAQTPLNESDCHYEVSCIANHGCSGV